MAVINLEEFDKFAVTLNMVRGLGGFDERPARKILEDFGKLCGSLKRWGFDQTIVNRFKEVACDNTPSTNSQDYNYIFIAAAYSVLNERNPNYSV